MQFSYGVQDRNPAMFEFWGERCVANGEKRFKKSVRRAVLGRRLKTRCNGEKSFSLVS